MKPLAKKTVRSVIGPRLYDYLLYRRHHCWLLSHCGYPDSPAEGEKDYIAKWRPLSTLIEPYSYRLFSHFCGPDPAIIPEDIMHRIVERRLNPPELWQLYEDKNNFARFVDPASMPATVASRQASGPIIYHLPLADYHSPLILKPAIDSSCGEGIRRFDSGAALTEQYLLDYGCDWVLQEAVSQHPLLAKLSHTAVATARLVVYRSVVDNQPHVTAAVLRVGPEGSCVDNIVAGGRFMSIDINDGRIGDTFIARFGERTHQWNHFDLSTAGPLFVPSWEKIVDLACLVADAITPHHLLALDIAVDEQGEPVLIEYNIGGFTTYLFHFTGQTLFGPYTDEVIEYVLSGRK